MRMKMKAKIGYHYKVLLVEDHEDFRKITADFLQEKFKFDLTVAQCGNEAIRLLSNQKSFDIVITDYFMPNGTGKDVLDYMSQNQIEIPTILFSGGGYDTSIFSHPKSFQFVDKTSISNLTGALSKILKSLSNNGVTGTF